MQAPSLIGTLTASSLMVASAAHGAAPPRIEVGQPFPEIVLPSLEDGAPMSIADFRGRKVLLHVFASW